jgi:hypothetical protein
MKEVTERELKRELFLSGFSEAAESSSFLMNQGDPNLIVERLQFLRKNGKLHPLTLLGE